MKNKIKLLLLSLLLSSCAPLPMIQSSRVTGKVGMGVSYSSRSQLIEVKDIDTACSICESEPHFQTNIYDASEQSEPRVFLRFGIKNRAELTVSSQPLFFAAIVGVQGNLKFALFEKGPDKLFRNISMAAFGGGDFFFYEWGSFKNAWVGLITGTHQNFGAIDLELVCSLSGSYFNQDLIDHHLGNKYLYYKSANLSLGCIMRPFRQKFLELNTGVTFRTGFDKNYLTYIAYTNAISSEVLRFIVNPVVFQCGVQIYIPNRHTTRE